MDDQLKDMYDGRIGIEWYAFRLLMDRIDEKNSHIATLESQLAWQPIETAPRDGTDIEVWLDIVGTAIIHIAFYREYEPDMPDSKPEDEGWWSYTENCVGQSKLDDIWYPKFWRHVTTPPEVTR